jgi:hypothetical protein
MAQVPLTGLGNVHRQVAHAFEVGVDLEGSHDGPQVCGHGLVKGEEAEASIIELDVQLIEGLVAACHRLDQGLVAQHEPLHGGTDPLLGQAAHFEQPGLHGLEFFPEVRYLPFHYPNRPVT